MNFSLMIESYFAQIITTKHGDFIVNIAKSIQKL